MGGIVCTDILCQRGAFQLEIEKLSIKRGEKVVLLGENGCGKTTLLEALSGLVPSDGFIAYEGKNWKKLRVQERAEHISYLPQESNLLFNLTVAELMNLSLSDSHLLQGQERKDLLKATEMENFQDRIFHSLSAGEKQRAMLARVLCRKSSFLFLDEPTAPLDMRHAAQLMNYISKISQGILVAMHDLNLAVRYFDRFLLMKNGRILFDKTKEDLSTPELEEIYGIKLSRYNDYFISDI